MRLANTTNVECGLSEPDMRLANTTNVECG